MRQRQPRSRLLLTPAYVSIRQLYYRCIPGAPAAASEQAAAHARALHVSSCYACLVVRGRLFRRWHVCLRQHTSACVITSAYVSMRQYTSGSERSPLPPTACLFTSQHTSACVSVRQGVSMRQHTLADVSIRQHASAYVSRRQHTSADVRRRQKACWVVRERNSIRQHAGW